MVDTGAEGETRRASAFVSATAYQILGRVTERPEDPTPHFLGVSAIHPRLAAPLLFLVAEQNSDAREAAAKLQHAEEEDLLRNALVETIYDLATEQFASILSRADRLRETEPLTTAPPANRAAQALYGLCWTGLVALVAKLLGQDAPASRFLRFDTPQAAFSRVVELSTRPIVLPGAGGQLISTYSGPRHLARILRHVADGLQDAGIANIPPPAGADPAFWSNWLAHRAASKPVLWRSHREAIATGFLDSGQSSVLVLPTGAGKTTVSELKVASTLAAQRKVLFLVPTLALIDQLRDDLTKAFPPSLGDVGTSTDGDLSAFMSGTELASIEVMTPERCLAMLSYSADAIDAVGLVVFDECHLLSPQGGGKRSLDAMLCLLHILKRAPDADLLLLSAMLTNGAEVADWLKQVSGRPCIAFEDFWKPSRQARGVVVYSRAELTRIRRAALAQSRAKALGRPSSHQAPVATPHAVFGLHNNWNPRVEADTRLVRLSDAPVELAVSKNGYPTPNSNGVAGALSVHAARGGLKAIVFVQQAGHAPSTARKIAEAFPGPQALTSFENELWTAIKAEMGGEERSLVKPTAGALPHNGDMLPPERRLAESLFRRAGAVDVIVATPTLAQGMNLPAQVAILAGDKRHEENGRSPLEAHEILNAAGRAGRAGYLANGVVILIPEPVMAFDETMRPEDSAFGKLRSILPANDRCVSMADPIAALLDRIQGGDTGAREVRYLISRLGAGEEDADQARTAALGMMRRSFVAYRARSAGADADFEAKLQALEFALDEARLDEGHLSAKVAASTGMAVQPLAIAQARLAENGNSPTTILDWSNWLIDFFMDNPASFQELLGEEAGTVQYVVRGKKKGGLPSAEEFAILKDAMRCWLTGRPLAEIETALGVPPKKLGWCPRSRDLVLKLANRSFYMVVSAIAELTKALARGGFIQLEGLAVVECLPLAFRNGFDLPDKIAYNLLRQPLRSRVLTHQAFDQQLGHLEPVVGEDFAAVHSRVAQLLAFLE